MRKTVTILTLVYLTMIVMPETSHRAQAQVDAHPSMASLDEYLMPKDGEIALARSAAPASISGDATVMVLERQGYITAMQGKNGFLCYVERSWAKDTDAPDFWDPKMRAPNCFNAAAASSIAQIYLMKTGLVLAGKSKAEIAQTIAAALDRGEIPPLAPGAICYMMSKDQYLNDQAHAWHPHVMFYEVGDVAKSWGANLPGSPMIAVHDPESRVTTFMIVVRHWSDGTPGPQ
ncbi:MAG TPA: hypothetical protein VGF88_19595 [Acidobacteriaceae bacterium]|jgi:hypothetical protein